MHGPMNIKPLFIMLCYDYFTAEKCSLPNFNQFHCVGMSQNFSLKLLMILNMAQAELTVRER